MIKDELLAGIAECEEDDALPLLLKLAERVGHGAVRDAYLYTTRQEGREDDRPRFWQVGEFLHMVGEPPPMLVDQLIPEKSLVLLSGKPKAGKSFLGLDLLDAVCQGRSVFGSFEVNRPGPVCYVGMEDGQYEIANRLLYRGIRSIERDRPFYVCPYRFRLNNPDNLAELERMIAGVQPVIIAIDTAREALGIRDWNDAAEVSDAVRPIRDFARQHCTVMLIAHNRKAAAEDAGDEIAGSNAFSSSVDGWISAYKVEKMDSGNRRIHLSINGRGGMRGDCVVEMDTENTHFKRIAEEDLSSERAAEDLQHKRRKFAPYLDAMREMPDQKGTVTQIATAAGAEYRTAYGVVQEMIKAKEIIDTGERYQQGPGKPSPVYQVNIF